jgi:hypothetical protein
LAMMTFSTAIRMFQVWRNHRMVSTQRQDRSGAATLGNQAARKGCDAI